MPAEGNQYGRGEGRIAKKVGLEVSVAVAEAVKLANADVVAAYPITPQTHIVEHLAELVADGELDAAYVPVESEHSAMSATLGASATGARAFTATAGQGLELMHEVLYGVSAMRLPVVMSVVNRALSAPLSVWGDHSDVMAVRDTGWVQLFVTNGQEAVDSIICAFRIAEDHRVLLPVMVHLDGFHLSHVIEPIILPEKSLVDRFLPPNDYPLPLNPARPVTMGAFAPPFIYTEAKKAHEVALEGAKGIVSEVFSEFARVFGREYHLVEGYRNQGAKVLLLTMGSFSETATLAVDRMREEGMPVGQLTLRLWRPFPYAELKEMVKGAEVLIVLDRALSTGGPGGPVASEIRSALYAVKDRPKVVSFVAGLGGRDISPDDFVRMIKRGMELARTDNIPPFEMFGVRE
ncbi:MAG: transketolase C-terminal domain-containing protein [Chloroflexota bacterium]